MEQFQLLLLRQLDELMMDHAKSTFACGCIYSIETLFCAKEVDELVEEETENVSFLVMHRGDWYKYQFAGAWSAISMATVKPPDQVTTVVAVAPHGAYWEVEPKSLRECHGGISAAKHSLRSLKTIGHIIYACGMGRTVLRRNGAGNWTEIGPDVLDDDGDSVIGFEDLAGFPSGEMYAVGWKGEIWQFANGIWQRLDSPVSANLNAVCCAADGKVYIVGDNGVMLHGRNNVWEVLEAERTDNLIDVAFYNDTIYVSTDFEILRLQEGTLTAEDAFVNPDDLPETCLHLLASEDGLVSMGTKDLFRLRNGLWERLV